MSFDLTTLGEIALGSDGAVDGPFGSNLKASSYTESGIPVIRGSNLSLGLDEFKSDEFVYVDDDTYIRLARSECLPQDIIFTKKGTLGQTGFVPQEPYSSYLISSNQMRLRVDPAKANPKYVYYWVSSKKAIDKIRGESEHTGVPKINLNYLKKLPISLPPLSYQNSAVKILDSLNDKIALNTQTNQTLEEMAQAIFKSWFVDFDPVKAKMNGEQPEGMDAATASLFPDKLVESELGLIPEAWEVGTLSSIVEVIMGQSPKGTTYNDQNEGTPLVNGPVEFGVYHPVAQKWTTAPTKLSKDKDLIVCVRGSTTGRYVVSDGEYCLGRGVCSIRSDDSPAFANYLFKSQLNNLLNLTTGSTFPSWSGPTLKNFKVVVPPQSIIKKFESIVGNLCVMMAQNTSENGSLSLLRDTLLPKLLSGEIKLEEK
ncbi:restriction endonuclease subunit S [Pseudoalteromonas sp. OOF1S-7]|uniref:restriction endonuclease subunit S n=1 Tax=Pseudoalteromonas sp. OOF1S-7 TaxID=2917757 RepID=UPI001EF6CFA2|nr:restriction endonuclease subunit S [Pseudoalteromonas sp. OOF1S-7]MCG7537017.1 restriction endonuclease subunit S [Pseudoalteromonas sp. OOF1S-7]